MHECFDTHVSVEPSLFIIAVMMFVLRMWLWIRKVTTEEQDEEAMVAEAVKVRTQRRDFPPREQLSFLLSQDQCSAH